MKNVRTTDTIYDAVAMQPLVMLPADASLFPTRCDVIANGVRFKAVFVEKPIPESNTIKLYNSYITISTSTIDNMNAPKQHYPRNLVAIINGNYVITTRKLE